METIRAIEAQTETAHHLPIESWSRRRLDEYTDPAESVDRCAESRILSCADLRCADAARINAWRCRVLDTPVRATGVGDVVERDAGSANRQGHKQEDEHAGARGHGPGLYGPLPANVGRPERARLSRQRCTCGILTSSSIGIF